MDVFELLSRFDIFRAQAARFHVPQNSPKIYIFEKKNQKVNLVPKPPKQKHTPTTKPNTIL